MFGFEMRKALRPHSMDPAAGSMPARASNTQGDRRDRFSFSILLGLAVAHGLLYTFVIPSWQHYDEPTHFEYAWLISNTLRIPERADFDQGMRREVAASMIEHRFFLYNQLRPPSLIQHEPVWIGFPELGHPPLYYMLLALPLRLVRYQDVLVQLYMARLTSLLLYVASVWIGYRMVGEFFPTWHPLRWAVPGMMVLLPAYVDLMTAVNSDVGAVTLFSLFLWGSVQAILRGLTIGRVLWMIGSAMLCALTKSTAAVAVLLAPVALGLAGFRARRRKWVWLGVAVGGLTLVLVVFSWGDAAVWYRSTTQDLATAQSTVNAVLGKRVVALQSLGEGTSSQLVQPLLREDVEALRGVTVTVGAWMWASQPVQAYTPALYDGQRTIQRRVDLTAEPAFHALTATIAADTDYVALSLRPMPDPDQGKSIDVYYDGIVLTDGERPVDDPPVFKDAQSQAGTWGGLSFVNRIRNGSAEVAWPYVRPWVDDLLRTYTRRSPALFLASILDWKRTRWVYRVTAFNLLNSFWARFGWNQFGLSSHWHQALGALTILGALGALVSWIKSWRPVTCPSRKSALGWLALGGLLVWGNAFLRPHPFLDQVFIPVARYAYPVIVPTVLALLAGWWALTPRRLRRWFLPTLYSALGLLGIVSLVTIGLFYYGR